MTSRGNRTRLRWRKSIQTKTIGKFKVDKNSPIYLNSFLKFPCEGEKLITNRINYSSESDDTNAGRAEMFFLFFNRTSAAGGERRQYGKVLKL